MFNSKITLNHYAFFFIHVLRNANHMDTNCKFEETKQKNEKKKKKREREKKNKKKERIKKQTLKTTRINVMFGEY